MHDISFEPGAQAFLYVISILHVIGFCLNTILASAIILFAPKANQNHILNLTVFIADALLCVVMTAVDTVNIGQKSNRISFVGCQIAGTLSIGLCIVIVFTIVFMCLYRYLVVIQEWNTFTHRAIQIVLASIFITGIVIAGLPVVLPENLIERHGVSSYGGTCLPDYSSRKPFSMFLTIGTVGALISTPLNLIFLYYPIYKKLGEARKTLESFHNSGNRLAEAHTIGSTDLVGNVTLGSSSALNKTKTNLDVNLETIIFRRALVMSGVFAATWIPITCIYLYEVITGVEAPYYVQGIGYCFVAAHSVLNPVLILVFDQAYREYFFMLFGWRKPVVLPTPSISTRSLKNLANAETLISPC